MKIELLKLKAELKVLALEIRQLKAGTRQSCSTLDKTYPERHDWDSYKILSKNEEFTKTQKTHWDNASALSNKQFEFRSKHIARCMLRGRKLEEIEPKLRDPNSYIHARVRKEAARIVASVLEAQSATQP